MKLLKILFCLLLCISTTIQSIYAEETDTYEEIEEVENFDEKSELINCDQIEEKENVVQTGESSSREYSLEIVGRDVIFPTEEVSFQAKLYEISNGIKTEVEGATYSFSLNSNYASFVEKSGNTCIVSVDTTVIDKGLRGFYLWCDVSYGSYKEQGWKYISIEESESYYIAINEVNKPVRDYLVIVYQENVEIEINIIKRTYFNQEISETVVQGCSEIDFVGNNIEIYDTLNNKVDILESGKHYCIKNLSSQESVLTFTGWVESHTSTLVECSGYVSIYPNPLVTSGTCGENITWNLSQEGLLEIMGTGTMDDFSNNSEPWFEYKEKIEMIKINQGVEKIGDYAFSGCKNLTEVQIPTSVIKIGQYCFKDCTSLETVDFPNSIQEIGPYSFLNCKCLNEVSLKDGLLLIGNNSFDGCTNIKSMEIPESVLEIGSNAFGNCSSLEWIYIPCTVQVIDAPLNNKGLFYHKSNYKLNIFTNAEKNQNGWGEFWNYGDSEKNVIFSTSKEEYNYWKNLDISQEKIDLPDYITNIPQCAFYQNGSIESITFSKSLVKINKYAFYSCSNSLDIILPNTVRTIEDYAFYGTKIRNLYIPDSVENISRISFGNVENMYLFKGSVADETIYSRNITYINQEEENIERYFFSNSKKIYLSENDTADFSELFIKDNNTSFEDATFKVDDDEIAMIYKNQLVGLSEGTTTLIYDCGEFNGELEIVVSNNISYYERISEGFLVNNVELFVGQYYYQPISAFFKDYKKEYSWSSSDTSKASVRNGLIYTKKSGSVTISCIDEDGNEYSYNVNIIAQLKDIYILNEKLELLCGESIRLIVYDYPFDNMEEGEINYLCDNENVIEVSSNGMVTAKKIGTATITVSKGQIKKKVRINVIKPLDSIELNYESKRLSNQETLQLLVTFNPEDTTVDRNIQWESSDEEVAIVNEEGLVTSVGPGVATITAKVGEYSASCKIISPIINITGIEINNNFISIEANETKELQVDFYPKNTTNERSISWSSSNESVAIVEDGVVKAIKPGICIITATSINGKEAQCEVIVKHIMSDTPTYEWSSDYTEVTARLECIDDPSINYEVTTKTFVEDYKNPTCTEEGYVIYSAEFECEAFQNQKKKVVMVPLGHDWNNGEITTKPTKTTVGVRTYQCSRDKNHKKEEEIPAINEEYLGGYSLSISGNIGVNFFIKLPLQTGFMQFKFPNGSVQKVNVSDSTKKIINGNTYSVFTCYVSAKDMTGIIEAQMHYEDGLEGELYSFTVENYANYILNNKANFDDKTISIVKAMLTYGSYAQEYFQFNETNLPFKMIDLYNVDYSQYQYVLFDNNENIDFIGARLVLTSKPGIKLYFLGDGTFSLDSKEVETYKEGKYTVLLISDIDDAKKLFEIKANNFNLKYGIYSYANIAMNSNNETLINLLKSMYVFYDSLY